MLSCPLIWVHRFKTTLLSRIVVESVSLLSINACTTLVCEVLIIHSAFFVLALWKLELGLVTWCLGTWFGLPGFFLGFSWQWEPYIEAARWGNWWSCTAVEGIFVYLNRQLFPPIWPLVHLNNLLRTQCSFWGVTRMMACVVVLFLGKRWDIPLKCYMKFFWKMWVIFVLLIVVPFLFLAIDLIESWQIKGRQGSRK